MNGKRFVSKNTNLCNLTNAGTLKSLIINLRQTKYHIISISELKAEKNM